MSRCLAGLVALVLVAPTTAQTPCPDFNLLDQQLDQKLLEVAPGMALVDLQSKALQVDNLTVDPAGAKEGSFLLVVEKGSGSVFAGLNCRFDAQNRLQACTANGGRNRIQRVTKNAIDVLAVGEYLPIVEGTLCPSQERTLLPGQKVLLRYTLLIQSPVNPTAQVSLTFDKRGRLEKKKVVVK